MHIVLEQSPTPIYQRLIEALALALVAAGHRISLLDPNDFIADQEESLPQGSLTRLALGDVVEVDLNRPGLADHLDRLDPDGLIIVSPISLMAGFDQLRGTFLYEQWPIPLVFLHYEDCFSTHLSLARIEAAIGSYIATAARSHHFCLESRNARDLRRLKVATSPLFAIAEGPFEPPLGASLRREVCFIGHGQPGFVWAEDPADLAADLQTEIQRRLHHLDHPLEPAARAYAQRRCGPEASEAERLALRAYFRSRAHRHSLEFRGEVMRRLGERPLDFYGPEAPSLCSSLSVPTSSGAIPLRRAHGATRSVAASAAVYRSSLISLNITALQFDQAVTNRVLDVAAAGGFPLTDWKADLVAITEVAGAISYRSLDELCHKIDYYSHPDHRGERLAIAVTLQEEVRRRGDYRALAQAIGVSFGSAGLQVRPLDTSGTL